MTMTRPIHRLTLPAILFAFLGAAGVLNAEAPVAPGLDRPLALSETAADLQWGDCPAIFPPGCKIAVLHGDPAEPGADVFLRVPSGYTIPAHSHTAAHARQLARLFGARHRHGRLHRPTDRSVGRDVFAR